MVWRQWGAPENDGVREERVRARLRNSEQREASFQSLFILFISMLEDSVSLTTMAVEFLTDGGGGDRRDEITGKERGDGSIKCTDWSMSHTHSDVLE